MKIRVKNIPLIVLIVWIYPNLYGQYTSNYQNNWHFGIGSGMNFSTISPTSIASSINGYEVTTCQSDGFGNTIFYAGANAATSSGSGFTVWDASNNTMPNGNVNMDYSSSCGLITAPVPGNCDQYYIFHLASTATGWGLFYSVVDMTLPGNGTVPLPLGDIVAGQKNILVYSADNLAEKIEIVQKGSTENYWVITRSITNDNFYCFEVSSTGVNSVPVTSAVTAATYPTAPFPSPIAGWLAASPDRSMLAEVNGVCDPTNVTLYSFDHQTGVVSFGEQLWSGVFGVDLPYGIEFSPNSSVLYFERFNSTSGNSFIHNYDLTAGMGNISLTQQDFIFAAGTNYGAMVRAKDGKIYKAQIATSTGLTVINSPNNYITPNIVFNQYSLAPTSTLIGLPNLSYYFHPDSYSDTLAGNDRVVCPGDQTTIGDLSSDSIWASYYWEPNAMVINPNNATTQTVPLFVNQQYTLAIVSNCGDTIKKDTAWVSATCFPLPVKLTSFNANCVENGIMITWQTATEINNDYFVLEKSNDAIHFFDLQTINGNGNSSSINIYSTLDKSNSLETNYYRLKQVDFDGNYTYSSIIASSCEISGFKIDNPRIIGNSLSFNLFNPKRMAVQFSLYDYTGKLITTEKINNRTGLTELIVPELSNGIYLLHAFNNEEKLTYKLLKN